MIGAKDGFERFVLPPAANFTAVFASPIEFSECAIYARRDQPKKTATVLLRVLPAFNDDPVGGGNRVLLNNAVVDGSTSQNAHIATWIAIWR